MTPVYQAEFKGEPRALEDQYQRFEGIQTAVTYLTSLTWLLVKLVLENARRADVPPSQRKAMFALRLLQRLQIK